MRDSQSPSFGVPHCRWCEEEARAREAAACQTETAEAAEARHPAALPQLDVDAPEPDYECVKSLGPFKVGDCVRLTALPEGLLEELDEWERPEYEAQVGQCFEIVAMMPPNIVDIACDCPGPNGEWGWEVFTMPLELLEAAEWDPEPEESASPS